jgi:hypothetical protein
MAEEERLTSDNLPLSRVTTDPLEAISVDWKFDLPDAVAAYIRRSLSENTKRAYTSDIRQFEMTAGALPASELAVATYIAEQAARLKVTTLIRRLAAPSKARKRGRIG